MNLKTLSTSLLLTSAIGFSAQSANLTIKIQNLTKGITYTPFLLAAHGTNFRFFEAGTAASPSLRALAEGGATSALASDAQGASGVVVDDPNGGLLAPGASIDNITMDTGTQQYLSIASMLLPSNDAFAGLDSWHIPSEPGTYILNLNAYDAGTENNNELLVSGGGAVGTLGMPASPVAPGSNGTGVADPNPNTRVHIHPGVLGDFDTNAGVSDIDSRVHRWLNPVVRVTVTVN